MSFPNGKLIEAESRCKSGDRSKESDSGVWRLTLCVSRLQFFVRKTAKKFMLCMNLVLDSQPCYLVFLESVRAIVNATDTVEVSIGPIAQLVRAHA